MQLKHRRHLLRRLHPGHVQHFYTLLHKVSGDSPVAVQRQTNPPNNTKPAPLPARRSHMPRRIPFQRHVPPPSWPTCTLPLRGRPHGRGHCNLLCSCQRFGFRCDPETRQKTCQQETDTFLGNGCSTLGSDRKELLPATGPTWPEASVLRRRGRKKKTKTWQLFDLLGI